MFFVVMVGHSIGLKADFHIHTRDDPQRIQRHSFEELILKAEQLRYSVLAVTNKNTVTYSKKLADFAKKHGILLIPGAEANISGKDVLILNHRGKLPKTFAELGELRRKNPDILTIAPHPYFLLSKCLKDDIYTYSDLFDALEYAHYHLRFYNPNKKAEVAAKKLNKPMLATSDAHQLDRFGKNYTWLDVRSEGKPTVKDVINAVRAGRVRPVSHPISIWRFMFIGMKVATVKLNNPMRRLYRKWDDKKKGRPNL